MSQEKTEKATPKKRSDERKKGNVFQSKDLIAIVSLLGMFYAMKFWMPYLLTAIRRLMSDSIEKIPMILTLSSEVRMQLFFECVLLIVICALPLLLISVLVNILAAGVQTKFLFRTESLKPKYSRIDFLQGIKKLISVRSLVELVKALVKIIVLIVIVWLQIEKIIPYLSTLMFMPLSDAVGMLGEWIMSIVLSAGIYFVFLSAFDYAYQRYDYEKNIRMSKQEIKEEYKQTEGDPQIKGKMRERQRAASMNRMMSKIPEADVIIRNPTHFAIAIKYDSEKNRAPMVVAKGQDHIAMKIIEIATEAKIEMVENKTLARGLYESVELEREIPEEFYQPVAEILAFVYSLKRKEK